MRAIFWNTGERRVRIRARLAGWALDGAYAALVVGIGFVLTQFTKGPVPFPMPRSMVRQPVLASSVHASTATTAVIAFIQDGTGRAVLLSSDGQAALVDGGPSAAAGLEALRLLRQWGISSLESVLITSGEANALTGLLTVLREVPVGRIYDAAPGSTCPSYATVMTLAEERGIAVVPALRGTSLTVGMAQMQVLLPASELSPPGTLPGGPALVMLHVGEVRFLLAGTSDPRDEELAVRLGGDLRAQVLELPGQGGADSLVPRFLDAVAPRIAVVSSGSAPDSSVLHRLTQAGVAVLRTDTLGDLNFSVRGSGMTVHFAPGLPKVSAEPAEATISC